MNSVAASNTVEIPCPECSQPMAVSENRINTAVICPHCRQEVLAEKLTPKPTNMAEPALSSVSASGQIIKCRSSGFRLVASVLLIVAGIASVIWLFGIVLIILGAMLWNQLACSNCGNRIESKHVKICPTCRARF